MNRVIVFFLLSMFWVLLTWPAELPGLAYLQDLGVGLAAALLVTWVVGERTGGRAVTWLEPKRYLWGLAYLFVLAAAVVKANVEVAYRVLHPGMPIRPGIVRVTTRLRRPAAQTVLGNSITLCPGTLTVDIRTDGTMMVHCIYIRSLDEDQARRRIIGRFEWLIEKIFK